MFKLRPSLGNRSSHRGVQRDGQPQVKSSRQREQAPSRVPAPIHTSRAPSSSGAIPPLRGSGVRSLAEYDRLMTKFENLQDVSFLPDMHVIVRLDAHRLGYHWASFPEAEYPLGVEFSQGLRAAAVSVLTSGIRVLFTFVHGDEISVAIDRQELANGRKKTRLVSALSSAASVGLCTALGRGALFHAKVSELPSEDHVIDYLLWQRLVARRNTIARYLGIRLLERSAPKAEVERLLSKATEDERLTALADFGVDYAALPLYEQRGALLWWAPAANPSPIRIEGQPYGIAECAELPDDALFIEAARTLVRGVSVATEGEAPVFRQPLPRREEAQASKAASEECDKDRAESYENDEHYPNSLE